MSRLFIPVRRATFLLLTPKEDDPSQKHPFIALTSPYPSGKFLSVNVSSIEGKTSYDKTCILRAGDHSFITKDSYVFYSRALIASPDELKKDFVTSGGLISEPIFDRICAGLLNSPYTAKQVESFYLKATSK